MIDIAINNLTKAYYEEALFENINMEVKTGERIGLLGDNGVGKTTLFRILLDEEPYQKGDVFKGKGLKIGVLHQIPKNFQDLSVLDVLMEAFKPLIKLKKEISDLEELMATGDENLESYLKTFGEKQEIYELQGGYEIEEKLSKITQGMNIDMVMQEKPYDILSGGEKSRVMLAKILLENPDVLLLDEPTNHLDIETSEWLEGYLKEYKGSALIISHDRYFLDQVIEKIYEIKAKGIEVYHGHYSYYLKERKRRYEQALRQYNAQQRKVKQMEAAASRMREWASRADNEAMFVRAKAMEKRIEKMDLMDQPIKDKNDMTIAFDGDSRSGQEVIRTRDFTLKVPGQILAEDINVTLIYGERVALIGSNGCGKSTFIKDILKEYANETLKDDIVISPSAKIGYLEQDIDFGQEAETILEAFRNIVPGLEGEIRSYLARFKFYGEDVFKPISTLSGGETVRLKLAILMKQDINFLILDEPTNHIDIKTREVLEEALESFEGTILSVSHDRHFLNTFANWIIEMADGRLKSYFGNYEYYKREKTKEVSKSKVLSSDSPPLEKSPKNKKPDKKSIDGYRVKAFESKIHDLEKDIDKLNQYINNNPSDYESLREAYEERTKKEASLEKLMAEYFNYLESFDYKKNHH